MEKLKAIPIVLTGTIIPNGVSNVVQNPDIRKTEYLRSLNFYSKFCSRIFFLENSLYPLMEDPSFAQNEVLQIRKLPISTNPSRGKGFQEFEMLESWLDSERQAPTRWLKISGRYLIKNIGDILQECALENDSSFIIDQALKSSTARTQIFYTATDYYRAQLGGISKLCDDRSGEWIERVLFRKLAEMPSGSFRFFRRRPQIIATSGTTGETYPSGKIGSILKQQLRSLNRVFDPRYLWWSR